MNNAQCTRMPRPRFGLPEINSSTYPLVKIDALRWTDYLKNKTGDWLTVTRHSKAENWTSNLVCVFIGSSHQRRKITLKKQDWLEAISWVTLPSQSTSPFFLTLSGRILGNGIPAPALNLQSLTRKKFKHWIVAFGSVSSVLSTIIAPSFKPGTSLPNQKESNLIGWL